MKAFLIEINILLFLMLLSINTSETLFIGFSFIFVIIPAWILVITVNLLMLVFHILRKATHSNKNSLKTSKESEAKQRDSKLQSKLLMSALAQVIAILTMMHIVVYNNHNSLYHAIPAITLIVVIIIFFKYDMS